MLLVPGCAGLLLGATLARTFGWTSPSVLGAFAVGVVSFAVWLWWEQRTPEPMIQLSLFGHRTIALATLAAIVVGAAMMGTTSLLAPLVMQLPAGGEVGLGLSPTGTGMVMLASAFIGYGAAVLAGRIAQRSGARAALLCAFGIGILAIVLWLLVGSTVIGFAIIVALNTGATSMAGAALPTLIIEVAPAENTGETTGMNRLATSLSVAIGVSLASLVLTTGCTTGSHDAIASGLTTVLIAILVVETIGIALTLAIRSPPPDDGDPVADHEHGGRRAGHLTGDGHPDRLSTGNDGAGAATPGPPLPLGTGE